MNFAASPCGGNFRDLCDFTCDDGYTAVGEVACQVDGTFTVLTSGGAPGGHRRAQSATGGRCEPDECSSGLTIAGSVSKNDEFRIKNNKFHIKNEKLCI